MDKAKEALDMVKSLGLTVGELVDLNLNISVLIGPDAAKSHFKVGQNTPYEATIEVIYEKMWGEVDSFISFVEFDDPKLNLIWPDENGDRHIAHMTPSRKQSVSEADASAVFYWEQLMRTFEGLGWRHD